MVLSSLVKTMVPLALESCTLQEKTVTNVVIPNIFTPHHRDTDICDMEWQHAPGRINPDTY